MTESEILSRYEIYTDLYSKTVNIEAKTMVYMVKRDFMPSILKYTGHLSKNRNNSQIAGIDTAVFDNLLKKLNTNTGIMEKQLDRLEKAMEAAQAENDTYIKACLLRDDVSDAMAKLRETVDYLETIVDSTYWPVPTYADILYYN